MYLISVLPGLRYISRKPQHILRSIHCRSLHLLNKAQRNDSASPLTGALPLNRDHALHPGRWTYSKAEPNKVQPYTYGRCFSTQPVNSGDVLIYTGKLNKSVFAVKSFSYTTSIISLCVLPQILMKTGLAVSSIGLKVALCSIFGGFTFLTPVLLHMISKKYVLRLYHNKDTDTYTAFTYNVFLMEKKTTFYQSEVTLPDMSRMFTTFYAGKHPMLVDPSLFNVPQDYNHLMGYDQPFSFADLEKPKKH
ncbi:transmembrane protein 70, mitochondrial [Salminus brasiliensis]|uniref:transmembrane protein 70, mitochondrial n=1 Tax=Salminus brasiliensis TaxID=930266 RepID=UPI003B839ABF